MTEKKNRDSPTDQSRLNLYLKQKFPSANIIMQMETSFKNQILKGVVLGIDKDGMTTARKLYSFLGMDNKNYSRWCKNNITENEFAE